ncbi:MAG: FHA domain-containing protein [Myxococcales bacterium]|nr:MAG: FHA domain-containing protein [Myxococcales bacterium]
MDESYPSKRPPVGPGAQEERAVFGDDTYNESTDELDAEPTHIEEDSLLAEQSTDIVEGGTPPPHLLVEQGSDQGKSFVLNPGITTVGRGVDNEVILTDVTVSRKHLRIINEQKELQLEDLGSGNGTLVNGESAFKIPLKFGDRIRIGETSMAIVDAAQRPGIKRLSRPSTEGRNSSSSGWLKPGASGQNSSSEVKPLYGAHAGTSRSRGTKDSVVVPRSWLLSMFIVGGLIVFLLAATAVSLWLRQSHENAQDQQEVSPDVERLLELGERALEDGQLHEAEEFLGDVLLSNPNDERAVSLMKRIRIERAKLSKEKQAQ